ncbi:UDP-glucosyltransferase 2-like [Nomia melanderi]|uniref:UDP-glucosyltransferase 2-like n=1 Tax=Nomia melanderi TaxID=2448451 RepID=UPI003FCC3C8E
MSSDLPKETLQVFFDVFDKLPYKVVWKYEKEPPIKRDNIFFGKWLPQQSILAHLNVKMFIYQGGLQSTEETVHFSVLS